MTNAPTTRETADHAELAIVAWAERGPESRELCDVQLFDALTDEEREAGWISEPLVTAAYAETLLSEIAALRVRAEEADALASKHFVALREKQDDAAILKHGKLEAERQRDELRKAVLRAMTFASLCVDAGELQPDDAENPADLWDALNATLLANQGADQ